MNEKILIVEDNPLHMKLMEMTFRNRGYTLIKASDGEMALDMATREKPDLIIMDIRLPKMNGLEVTTRLRKDRAFRETPIIALTAHALSSDRAKSVEVGCSDFDTKPVDLPRLLGKIEAALKLDSSSAA